MSYKRDLLPKMALERLGDNPDALFVDVRSKAEHKYVGYPEDSILIPWIRRAKLGAKYCCFS